MSLLNDDVDSSDESSGTGWLKGSSDPWKNKIFMILVSFMLFWLYRDIIIYIINDISNFYKGSFVAIDGGVVPGEMLQELPCII